MGIEAESLDIDTIVTVLCFALHLDSEKGKNKSLTLDRYMSCRDVAQPPYNCFTAQNDTPEFDERASTHHPSSKPNISMFYN